MGVRLSDDKNIAALLLLLPLALYLGGSILRRVLAGPVSSPPDDVVLIHA
jgi:hypothetical protein